MMLRSSSTPVLGSLLPSFSDSPNNNHHHETNTTIKHLCHIPPAIPNNHHNHKLPFGSRNLPSVSCNSSPISPSVADHHFSDSHRGFRRVQSDGNLEGLAYAYCTDDEDHEVYTTKLKSGRNKSLTLEAIPSFSFSRLRGMREEEEDETDIEDEEEREYLLERNNGRDRERVMAMEGGEFSFKNEKASMVLSEQVKVMDNFWNVGFEGEREEVGQEIMYLARGLGIGGGGGGGSGGGGGGGGGGEFKPTGSGGDGGDNHEIEEHYKRMVEENPGNPLFLRNYAQFLYQGKKDLNRAEEYYSRAILADPGDGDILLQYAKLVWELHGDQERASTYFERAMQAAPLDSHVHAAYANFLWETEEGDDECNVPNDVDTMGRGRQLRGGALASANV